MSKRDGAGAAVGRLVAGRYLLEVPIGAGGMGSVWRATDQQLGRVVALKRAHPGLDDPHGRRLRREARIGAGLHHPHVVTIFDVVTDGTDHWLVLEYVPSRSLAELGVLPPAQVARIGVQIASALQAVHAAGVVHRDIKPGNVLVGEDGTAKLADFGISRRVWADATLTDSSTMGTPAHLAPEVANGAEAGPASDVFSLGAVLYTAVEGHSPFGGDHNPLAVLRKAARAEILPGHRAGELTPLIASMLQVDPADRPTAQQVATTLSELTGTSLPEAPNAKSRGRRQIGVVAVAAAAVLLVGVLVIHYSDGATPQADRLAPQVQADPSTSQAKPTPRAELAPVGDPATADPCALLDPAALRRFGETDLETDYGNFNRCDVIVKATGGREVDVRTELESAPTPDLTPAGMVEKHGSLSIIRQPEADGQCTRTLLLSDRNRIIVTAKQTEGHGSELCAAAEAASKNAVAVVDAGAIPRRVTPIDKASLARTDACSLLDPKALALVPGVDGNHPDVGFGDWTCGWDSTTGDLSVDLRFDRDQPLTAADGRPTRLAGHSGFIAAGDDGPDTCVARIVHRPYADPYGHPANELVILKVSGPSSPNDLCRLTIELARAAAGKLPRT